MFPASSIQAPASRHADEALLRALGERVRQVRTQRGMTRRALAQQSQVSERYLAQLEGGQGNVSIRVLQRVAAALGSPLADLLDAEHRRSVEYTLLVETLKTLPPARLARLRQQILRDIGAERTAEAPRVALVGLRGAGKSTLGARLARHFEVPFIELDREIERRSGAPLEELFLLYGQAAYRRHELKCLSQVIDEYPACVIATGGSLVSEPAAYAMLLAACVTVWLRATPAEHMARVIAQGDLRPMAGNPEAMADLERILAERVPLYARADCVVDTSGRDEDAAFHALIDALHSVSAQEKSR